MRISRCLFASMLFLTLAVGQARADVLQLSYFGQTAEGSSLAGTAFNPGTDFEVHASFDSVPNLGVNVGIANYQTTEITEVIGGTSYSVTDSLAHLLQLRDLGPGSGFYAALVDFSGAHGFVPFYDTTTTPFDATAASPTIFSGYTGSGQNALTLSTASGDLVLTYDTSVGIATSITGATVPEPSSLVLMGLGGSVLLAYIRRRRAAT